jgi:type III pantothenate kinase
MRAQLKTHTRRIRYDQQEAIGELHKPGRNTADAVERGCVHMIRSFADGQVALARELLGGDFRLFLTGGDAAYLADRFAAGCVVPDLVFRGLALACPVNGEE